MRILRSLLCAMIALAGLPPRADAQQIETPIAFDSAGKVRSLTPQLVQRYSLTAPAWPVTGSFREARLFQVSTGGRVLVVERTDGSIERFPITDDQAAALRFAIDAGMRATGATPVESQPTTISEPARNAFARNQMLLSIGLYGPLLASLADDGQTGTALYLLGAGGSFFISLALSKELDVTRAQNHLATDGAIRGYATMAGLIYTSGAETGHKTYSALGLAGALTGSVLGYHHGKGMTDAEAEAATTISTLAGMAGFGLTAALGGIGDENARAPVGSAVGAGLVGYFMGPNYPRRASYTVTRGDVQMLSLGSILGAAVALTPIVDSEMDEKLGFGITTAGLLSGAFFADKALVRKFDYSMSDATQIQLATAAGALMGAALAVLTEPGPKGVMALVTGGGILGAMAGQAFAQPPLAGRTSLRSGGRSFGTSVRFDPSALGLAAVGAPGRHAVLSLTF